MRFAVHRPGSPRPFPRSNRPPGGRVPDVARCVHVGVVAVPANLTQEERLALAILPCDVLAGIAGLRGVSRGNPDHSPGRLRIESRHERPPTGGGDAPVQPGLLPDIPAGGLRGALDRASHGSDIEILHNDQIESAGEICAGLLHPVLTAVGSTRHQPGTGLSDIGPAPGSLLGATESTLQSSTSFDLPWTRPGCGQQLSRGQRRTHHDPPVESDDFSSIRSPNRLRNGSKAHVPATRPIECDPEGLDSLGHRARPTEAHPAHLGDPQLAHSPGHPAHVCRTHRDDPEPLVTSYFPPRRAALGSDEEASEGLREIPQCLLLDDNRAGSQPGRLLPRVAELSTLLSKTRRARPPGSPVPMLLDCEVPDISRMCTVLQQLTLLSECRLKPVASHAGDSIQPHRQIPESSWPHHGLFPSEGLAMRAVGIS